jgi:predicted MFS family arabinose efflux permease
VIGLYAAASAVGGFLGRFVPGMLADHFGWRGGFLALACGSVICLVVVFFLLQTERKFISAASFGSSLRQMVGHLRNPLLLATFAVGFGVLFNFIATFTYLSFHLAAPPFNRSPAFLGSVFVVYLFGSVAALYLGRAIARMGRRNFVLLVIAVWACGMLLSLIPSTPAIVGCLIVASTCGILTQASSTSFVAITAKTGTSPSGFTSRRSISAARSAAGCPALPTRPADGPILWRWCLACCRSWRRSWPPPGSNEAAEGLECDDHAGEAKRPDWDQSGAEHTKAQARHVPDQSR